MLGWRCWLVRGCSLWIVNQVLVRFGRAGRLGGFILARERWGGLLGVRDGFGLGV